MIPAFACEKGHMATLLPMMTSMSDIISSIPFPFWGSGPIVIRSYPWGTYLSPRAPGTLPPNALTSHAPGPHVDRMVGFMYQGWRLFLPKLYSFVPGFGASFTSFTGEEDERGSERWRR